jgi:hypothetical protein
VWQFGQHDVLQQHLNGQKAFSRSPMPEKQPDLCRLFRGALHHGSIWQRGLCAYRDLSSDSRHAGSGQACLTLCPPPPPPTFEWTSY